MIKLHQEKTVIFSVTDRHTHLLIISYVICTSPLCHSYVIECHLNITPMCLYVIPVPLLCSRVSFVCQLYVLISRLNASHMGSYVIPMSLVMHLYFNRFLWICMSLLRHCISLLVYHLFDTCMYCVSLVHHVCFFGEPFLTTVLNPKRW